MTCKLCLKRGKPWKGDDPVCYFDNPQRNWNCATLHWIRHLVFTGGMFAEGRKKLPYGVNKQYCDDYNYATIKIDEVRANNKWFGTSLYLEWYKNRGHTDTIYVMSSHQPPKPPTEEELLAVIEYYRLKKAFKGEDVYYKRKPKPLSIDMPKVIAIAKAMYIGANLVPTINQEDKEENINDKPA